MGLSCKGKSSVAICNSTEPKPGKLEGSNLQLFKFKDLECATNNFSPDNLLVKASHGLIFKGTLKDGHVVAVKRPTLGARLWHDEDAFENETQILSKLFSRRLVNLLGHSQDGKAKLLVVEHMPNGSLHDRLHGTIDRAACLSWPMRVQLALQVAKAIRALHASSPPIVHRNIRSMNVFLDSDWNARLGDFGLARCAHASSPPRRSSNLTPIPEEDLDGVARFSVFEDDNCPSHITTKTDVFNFGMLLLEIMSGRSAVSMNADFTPFSLLDWALPLIKHDNAIAICDQRLKPPELTATVKQMAVMAARCVRATGSRRPSMDDVVHGLTNVSKLLPVPMWSGFTGFGTKLKANRIYPPSLCKANRIMSLPFWTGFFRLKKRRRAIVFGLGKFMLAQKRRLQTGKYLRLPAQKQRQQQGKGKPISAAKVSDEEVHCKGPCPKEKVAAVSEVNVGGLKKTGSLTHWSYGKHSLNIQMENGHERAAVRGL